MEEKWKSLADISSSGQRDYVGMRYLKNILRITPDELDRFIKRESNAQILVAQRLVELPPDSDRWRFWWEMDGMFPGIHTPREFEFLVDEGGYQSVEVFLMVMTCWLRNLDQTSKILAMIKLARDSVRGFGV